jgi:hypothetical protein
MRTDSNSAFSWAGALGQRRANPARKPRSSHLELEAMEDRLVPAVLDLTTAGALGTLNGAVFQQAAPQPTGCGVIHDFLRIQSHGSAVEQGYNTDARPLQFDEKQSPTFTRSLALSDVPQVTAGGVTYSEFLLGVNQSHSNPLLSLDELRLYVGNAPDLTGYDPSTNRLAGLSPAYDMGAGNFVMLNAALTHGNGSGDMYLLVPSNLLQAAGGSYVYLYSKFGVNAGANGGFEQWALPATPVAPALSSLSGSVLVQGGPGGVGGAVVTLSGTTAFGQSVSIQVTTDVNGGFGFTGLVPGTYTVTETAPPGDTLVRASVGSQGGSVQSNLSLSVALPGGVNGVNNNFVDVVVPLGGS